MIRIFRNPNYDFMGLRLYGYLISAVILVGSIAGLVMHKSRTGELLNYGIDFKGGTLMQVQFQERPEVDRLRDGLGAAGFANASIQAYGDPKQNTVLIRVSEQLEEKSDLVAQIRAALRQPAEREKEATGLLDLNTAGEQVIAAFLEKETTGTASKSPDPIYLRAGKAIVAFRGRQEGGRIASIDALQDLALTDGEGTTTLPPSLFEALQKKTFLGSLAFLRTESVGPAVGAKLRTQALWASIVATGLILAYLWFRFELRFGVSAVICIVHDVIFIVGVFAWTRREFDLTVLAGILTVIGYSVNDTVVVFDRVRSNLRLMKKERLESVLNASINQTLSRTIMTSGFTLMVLVALYIWGGEVLNNFAFALLIGIIEGTFSSIFVASPLLLLWQRYVQKAA